MGGFVSNVIEDVGNIGQSAIDTVGDIYMDIRDPLEAAAVVAGNYYLPGSSLVTSRLVSDNAQQMLASDVGQAANIAAGATGGMQGNLSNYGQIGENLGITSSSPTSSAVTNSGGSMVNLGTATGADLSAAYDMGAVGSAGAGGFTPVASSGGLGIGNLGWGSVLGAASLAAKALGGSQPTSSTTTTAIDPQMKEAYLRNLEEARTTAAGLGPRQFAAFPQYNLGMVQQYMNPYQEEVVNNAMKDIERQRQTQMAQEGAAATAARAFGGSRQAVQRALVDEAALRQSGALGAQLRQQGFTQAQNLALQQEQLRQAYEQQKLDAARNLGLERLNVSQGALSLQPANIGSSQTSPIYRNQTASALGGALSGGMLGRMVGGTANPEYAGYGALAGGLLGFM
jgi:hypothetical protein